jgi:hypothetical protein
VFGSPPTLYCRRTFSSSESIFKEAALPSFLKSSLSTAEVHIIHLTLLPLNLISFFYIPFKFEKSLHLPEKPTDGMRDFFAAVKILFLCCRNFKDKG